jgi:hypothetical protein
VTDIVLTAAFAGLEDHACGRFVDPRSLIPAAMTIITAARASQRRFPMLFFQRNIQRRG